MSSIVTTGIITGGAKYYPPDNSSGLIEMSERATKLIEHIELYRSLRAEMDTMLEAQKAFLLITDIHPSQYILFPPSQIVINLEVKYMRDLREDLGGNISQ